MFIVYLKIEHTEKNVMWSPHMLSSIILDITAMGTVLVTARPPPRDGVMCDGVTCDVALMRYLARERLNPAASQWPSTQQDVTSP